MSRPVQVPAQRTTSPFDLRASDADRERVAEVLNRALGDGRLTFDEHAERLERTFAARTLGDLVELTTDLVPGREQPIHVHPGSPHVLFGSEKRSGRWVVPERFPVTAFFGTVELDLREALLQRRHVMIHASLLFGTVNLIVPEGVRVEFTGRSIVASRELKARPGDNPQPPMIEITGTVIMGRVSARTPKRRWRDRLLRRHGR